VDTVYNSLKMQIENTKTITYCTGYLEDDVIQQALIDDAVSAAVKSDVSVIFVGLSEGYESEGFDRTELKLPKSHEKLIEEILKRTQNVVVVLSNGAPVSMPWKDQVPAIIEGYLNGQAGASAMVDILFGEINPSGKIAETFPEDTTASRYFTKTKKSALYKESFYVGYRYYDRFQGDVAFPFGHGLSYTTFDLWDGEVSLQTSDDKFSGCTAVVKVGNIGHRSGKAIVQAYVSALDSKCHRPLKVLGQFDKVDLEAGKHEILKLEIQRRAFESYNLKTKKWHVEPGNYEVRIGFSSVDLPIVLKVVIHESFSDGILETTEADQLYTSEYGKTLQIEDEKYLSIFELTGRLDEKYEKSEFDLNTPIYEMRKTMVGRILMLIIRTGVKITVKKQKNEGMKNMVKSITEEITLRNLVMMTGGAITQKMTESFLTMAKGQYIKGIKMLIKRVSYKKEVKNV